MSPQRAWVKTDELRQPWRLSSIGLILFAFVPMHARAQVAGNIALSSSDIFRGESISGNDPALSVAGSIDHESGLFAGGSVTASAGQHKPRLTSANQYLGYAVRIKETSFELGLVHRDYGRMHDLAYRKHYVEGFVGISRPAFRLRAYVSPNYLKDGRMSYYGEATVRIARIKDWSITAHGGISLIPQDVGSPKRGMRSYGDWSVQLNRKFGPIGATLGIARTSYPVFRDSKKARLALTLSHAF